MPKRNSNSIYLEHENINSLVPTNSTISSQNIQKTVKKLRERINLLEAVIDNFPGGILLFDKDLKLALCNRQQRYLLEYPPSFFTDQVPTLEEIFWFNAERGEYGPGQSEEHVATRMALVAKKTPHVFERTRPNGTALEIRGVPLPQGGFVTTYLDVTEQRRAQATIAHLAHHDSVTGLPNRVKLLDQLNISLSGLTENMSLAVHYIDLDRFKPINDNFGHAVGDEILRVAAKRMGSVIRKSDTLARIGGDEFVIIQTGTRSPNDADRLAQRVLKAVSQKILHEGISHSISGSIGIAVAPSDGDDAGTLMRKADDAMYKSKDSGGDMSSFYTSLAGAPDSILP